MKRIIKSFLACLLVITSLPLMAMTLQQAMGNLSEVKAQGLVGEKPDGYLGVVSNSANATEIVNLINEARLTEYQRLAKENNISVADVQAMAGQKAIEKTPSGQYVQVNTKWVKKL